MSGRLYALALVSILSGSIAGCSCDRVDDASTAEVDGDDTKKIVYAPPVLVNTSRPGVVSAIRPFLSRVRPEDPKKIAIHFATRYGPGVRGGVWQEPVMWDTTLASLRIKVKTPGGETFEIRPQPAEVPDVVKTMPEDVYQPVLFTLPSAKG